MRVHLLNITINNINIPIQKKILKLNYTILQLPRMAIINLNYEFN